MHTATAGKSFSWLFSPREFTSSVAPVAEFSLWILSREIWLDAMPGAG